MAVRCILSERELPGAGEVKGDGGGGMNCVTRDWHPEIEETTWAGDSRLLAFVPPEIVFSVLAEI